MGEIYAITNTVNGCQYIGQTVTHRLNHDKYRPFGTFSRFKHHLSESKYNKETKRKGYLQTAIKEFGQDAFKVERLHVCPIDEMDRWECHYIEELHTTYPKGYNLTTGGKAASQIVPNDFQYDDTIVRAGNAWRHKPREESTRKLISENVKKALEDPQARATVASRTRDQHMATRLALFAPVAHLVDRNALESHVKVRRSKADNSIVFAYVAIEDKKTRFHATETSLDAEAQALEFLKLLVNTSAPPSHA